MSYPPYLPPFSVYPSAASSYTHYQPTHYPSHYPPTQTTPASFPFYHISQPRLSPPTDRPPSPPDLSSITPSVAFDAIERFLSSILKNAGFDAAQPVALQRLHVEVVAFVERLYERAHEYSNLANRSGPIITDLILACQDMNLQPKDLRRIGVSRSRKKKRASTFSKAPALEPAPPRSPSPVLLPSDDEDTQPTIPATLLTLPLPYPNLPPRHTYLRTPPSPPKKAALPSLEKKLKTASLVQQSLKSLLLATEDSEGQEDAELLGHIVNWETGLHPRKRWRIG